MSIANGQNHGENRRFENRAVRAVLLFRTCALSPGIRVICATWFLGCSGVKGSLNQRPNVSEPWFDLRRAFPGDSHVLADKNVRVAVSCRRTRSRSRAAVGNWIRGRRCANAH